MVHSYTAQVEAFERYHIQQQEEGHGSSSSDNTALPALGHAVSGAAGSAIANTITYPLSLIITRLQVQSIIARSKAQDAANLDVEKQSQDTNEHVGYTDVLDAVRRIYAEEGGISAFYAGCLQDVGKSVLDSFLFFLAYNFVRRTRLQVAHSKRLPVHEEIAVGMVAGAFAKLITTPMSNIVTRKQTASMFATQIDRSASKDVDYLSTANIASQIYKEKGLKGFWAGYSASLVLTINPSLTMLMHGALLRALVPADKRAAPGSVLTFLLAATSKAFASSVTYPFQLAKSRLQVAGRVSSYNVRSSSSVPAQKGVGEKLDQSSTYSKPRKSTILSTVINIAREEGIMSLYQGLPNEIVKGFFQHGLTMLMKERVHMTVINLYSVLYTFMQTHPPPGAQTLSKARESVGQATDLAGQQVKAATSGIQDALAKPIGAVSNVTNSASETLSNATDTARTALTNATTSASETLTNTTSTVAGAAQDALLRLSSPSISDSTSSIPSNPLTNTAIKAKDEMASLGEASQKMLEEVAKRSQRSVGDVREKVKEMSDRVVDVMIELIKEGKNAKADFETGYVGLPGSEDD